MDRQPWLRREQVELDELRLLCPSFDDLELIISLLGRFLYLRGDQLEDCKAAIANHVNSSWGLTAESSRVVTKASPSSDNSVAVNYLMQPTFAALNAGWLKQHFTTNLRLALKSQATNLLLIDDFSGSGNSLLKLLGWIEQETNKLRVQTKDVYACFFCAMEATKNHRYPSFFKGLHWASLNFTASPKY